MKRDVFLCYEGCWVVLPNGHLLFSIVQCLMFKGSRVVSRMAIFFCPMSNVQWVSGNQVMPNGHLFYCPMLMPSQSRFFFVLLLGKYLCCIVMFIFIYYLLTYLVFLNLQQNSKKGKSVTRAEIGRAHV